MSSSPPYLPTEQRGRPRRSRLLQLGFAVVVFFVALYILVRPTAPHHAVHQVQKPTVVTSDPPFFTLGATFFAVAFIAWVVWIQRRTRAFHVATLEALKLRTEADYDGAVARFESLAMTFQRPLNVQQEAQYNLAAAVLRRGDLTAARARLEGVDRTVRFKTIGVGPAVAVELAMVHALAGSLDLAATWETEAEKRLTSVADARMLSGRLALVRAIRVARQGNYGDVVQTLDTRWRELENAVPGDTLRPLRVVRAFVTAQARGVREAGGAETQLVALHPSRPREFAMLGAAWPEMSTFLIAHGLG